MMVKFMPQVGDLMLFQIPEKEQFLFMTEAGIRFLNPIKIFIHFKCMEINYILEGGIELQVMQLKYTPLMGTAGKLLMNLHHIMKGFFGLWAVTATGYM